ncbi:hypothetical protein Taro_017256 [Colocasia esculenta]|uniref:Uncharacterized protein n=1 Tax=Colocasia esculenta TaxID=4460 RepID=A0A843UMM2_COLES|nr:hypothetical protein [Colocasia esculenta]
MLVSTPSFEHKAKTCRTGQVVLTLVQVVSTLETGSVDTSDLPRTPSGLFWDSVSTLVQVVSTLVPFQRKTYRSRVVSTLDQLPRTFWVKLGQCVDTSSGSVDTSDLPRTPSGLFWDSVSTLVQVVSTLVPFQRKTYRSRVT